MKPGDQGKRNDLKEATDKILAKRPLSEIAEEHPNTFVRYSRGLRDLANTVTKSNRSNTWDQPGKYLWIWGPTGSGKTTGVITKYGADNVYIKSGGKWFDGFDPLQHRVILIDDYRLSRESLQLDDLLRIAQPFTCQVEIKGGYVNLSDQAIIVTSNLPPDSIWPGSECEPLKRRFHIKKMIKEEELNDSPPGFINLVSDEE